MKSDQTKGGSITQPILKDLMDRAKEDHKLRNPSLEPAPLKPSALYEDAGGAYNANFTYPQD